MSETLAIAPLTSRAVVAVTGADWRSFLQGQLTQDVDGLAPGELRFGALLTPQGRLLDDLFIVGASDGCLLDVARSRREALIARLSMFRLRAQVEFAPSEMPVHAAWGAEPTGAWMVDPRLAALGWRRYGAAVASRDEADYDRHRLALGVPGPADWGVERTYPIEAGFDLLNGIDFKKGCFVGQETTSRMKRRGVIKSRMLPVVFDGPRPPPGAELLAGELRAGEVLSGAGDRAMALVRLDRALGAELTVAGAAARVEVPGWMAAAVAPSAVEEGA